MLAEGETVAGEGCMTAQQLLDGLLAAGTKIDNLWSMYIVVHLGVFWFFFLMQRPLLFIERFMALLAYSIFAYINGMALISSYRLLEAMRSDAVLNFRDAFARTPETLRMMMTVDYSDRDVLILLTHLGAWVFVALILLFRNSMIRYYRRHYPEYSANSPLPGIRD